ncbi:MAG: phospholipase D-like domain-containing protein [Actinomycetota bacterium]
MPELELLQFAEEQLFAAIDRAISDVVLVSPFLSIRVAQRLARAAGASRASWSLLTHLDPIAAAGGYLSIEGLRQLHEVGVAIRHIDALHAKVYLADEFAMVGSANLTNTGLGGATRPNLELSVRLAGEDVVHARRIIDTWWKSSEAVGLTALADLEARVRTLPRLAMQRTSVEAEPLDNVVGDQTAELVADARHRSLWVKAQYGGPNAQQWLDTHWFSSSRRGRPSFKEGDLVLIYSKEAHASYAIVEVRDAADNNPSFVVAQGYSAEDGARWPWVNTTTPRLVPTDGTLVSPADLGFTGQGLQGGHRRIGVAEFVVAVYALAGTRRL